MKKKIEKICSRCVMDATDSNIVFDVDGTCSHCAAYDILNTVIEAEAVAFQYQLTAVRNSSSKYDCLIGVSGGLDSTYLLIHAVKDLGLKPLALHVDNGWNTGLANRNVANLCDILGIDLVTKVLDWDEFRQMQLAILAAGTPDLEAPTDLFINYTLREVAKQFKIKYIFSGTNPQTEGVMGSNWSYGQRDPIYLKGLFELYWGTSPQNLPFKNWYLALIEQLGSKINIVRPLKFINYGKKMAVDRCIQEVDWIEYPRKHGESFITRFYQNFFLPARFGFDKRKAHYSALVLNGDMLRDDALKLLKLDDLTSLTLESEIEFLCKKLQITPSEFNLFMSLPLKFHADYRTLKNTIFFRLGATLKKFLPANSWIYKFVRNLISN